MPTSNKIVTVSGTGYTVDVTVCNLDADLTLKDFVVLHNGVLVSNTNYTKTTRTILTYTGTALPSTTVEVRRRTPTNYILGARYGSRIRSDDWNKELDRITRRAEEYELNGVGAGSITGSQAPQNDPFGASWASDIVYPPTRQAVYSWGVNLVNATQLSSTLSSYVTNTALSTLLTNYALSASPSFTGNPTVPTQLTTDSSTRIANTAFVQNLISGLNLPTTYAPLASPTFTGTPSAPTPAAGNSSTRLATTAFVSQSQRPFVDATRNTTPQALAHNTYTTLVWNNEISDADNVYNSTTGAFTVPAGLGGYYEFTGAVLLSAGCNNLIVEIYVNGVSARRIGQSQAGSDVLFGLPFTGSVLLGAGDVVTLRFYLFNGSSASRDMLVTSGAFNWVTMKRLNV
ncbi:tail fiber-like protein [Leptolyngbya phage LPP-2, strain SPI]|uniref:Tail fiber-like protein n=1 Tax=Leptolyngbya phage LPP-2, strain SPI TaxID=2996053 RepID=A0A9Y1GT37_9CAUD|nr:tail fiber-like protein [Leptolyngbya phage LPP-2 st. SPI]